MIQVDFEYDKDVDWLTPRPKEKKYVALESIGNRGWTSERVIEDLENVAKCKLGEYRNENGDDNFAYMIGIENSPGEIAVANWGPAWVSDAWDSSKDHYLELSLDELEDFLLQMRDFLISVGK